MNPATPHEGDPTALAPGPWERATSSLTRLVARNPLWQRELLQASRLTRTPVIAMTISILFTVVIGSLGGLASSSTEPADLGAMLYQVFFSCCFLLVTWVSPAIGTLVVTSEHGNRTWEALRMTGMPARQIARGKFLAALSHVGVVLLMLAPIGAVPFVTGGVTALEVVFAFALLGIFAALSVGYGIAIGAAFERTAPAILLSVVSSVMLSLTAFVTLGFGGSWFAHRAWPEVTGGAPVWLPAAYARATFDAETLATLVLAPGFTAIALGWLSYELAVAHLSRPDDDRYVGLKRWLLVCFPLLVAVSLLPRLWLSGRDEHWGTLSLAMGFTGVLAFGALLLLAGDAFGPSRWVAARLESEGAGWFRRALGPGLGKSALLVLALAALCFGVLLALTIPQELATARAHGLSPWPRLIASGLFVWAAFGFLVFACGVLVFLRSRLKRVATCRVLLCVACFVVLVGPWVVWALSGSWRDGLDQSWWLTLPSPLHVLVVASRFEDGEVAGANEIWAAAASGFWALLGVVWWILGARRITALTEAR